VQNSEATRELQEAKVAAGAAPQGVQVIGDKTFALVDGVWRDLSSGDEPPAERITIAFGSDAFFALLDEHPDLARYLSVGTRALIHLAGVWYEITDG
jgi:hypothetical protein